MVQLAMTEEAVGLRPLSAELSSQIGAAMHQSGSGDQHVHAIRAFYGSCGEARRCLSEADGPFSKRSCLECEFDIDSR